MKALNGSNLTVKNLMVEAMMTPYITEIERMIFLSLLDSWIQRLIVDVRLDSFFPGVASYCDNIATEANAAYERTFKLQGDLLNLGLDQASLSLLAETLTALRKKEK